MHLWRLFQSLVIKGPIIMTASNVHWRWAAIFPLITPSQSLIYCQPFFPVPRSNLLSERQRACPENRVEGEKKSKGERGDRDWWMRVWWIKRQPAFREASECVWVFFQNNFVSEQNQEHLVKKKKGRMYMVRNPKWYIYCNTQTIGHTYIQAMPTKRKEKNYMCTQRCYTERLF